MTREVTAKVPTKKVDPMHEATAPEGSVVCQDTDAPTDEEARAVALFQQYSLDLRAELERDPIERKVALYERTFGLAVIPVLIVRALRNTRSSLMERAAGRR